MARTTYAIKLDGSRRVRLDDVDPADTAGVEKDEAHERIARLGDELAELENLLTYAGTHALLVVLQGRDASGKDGSIRKILEYTNVQNAYVKPFKVPTEEERAHDFLWRVHAAVPRKGYMALFNRSHYEDVLAARVHRLVPDHVWRARYDQINGVRAAAAGRERHRPEVLPAHQPRRNSTSGCARERRTRAPPGS